MLYTPDSSLMWSAALVLLPTLTTGATLPHSAALEPSVVHSPALEPSVVHALDVVPLQASAANGTTNTTEGSPYMLAAQYAGAFAIPILMPWGIGGALQLNVFQTQILGVWPAWIQPAFLTGTATCYVGWEMFVTFGLAGGKSFMSREPNQFGVFNGNAMNCILSMPPSGSSPAIC